MRLIDADALIKAIEDSRCADCPDKTLGVRCAACQWDDAIAMIEDAPVVSDWISVEDKLPAEYTSVLFVGKNFYGNWYNVQRGFHVGSDWFSDITNSFVGESVTHWMPLPKRPIDTD